MQMDSPAGFPSVTAFAGMTNKTFPNACIACTFVDDCVSVQALRQRTLS